MYPTDVTFAECQPDSVTLAIKQINNPRSFCQAATQQEPMVRTLFLSTCWESLDQTELVLIVANDITHCSISVQF